MPSILIILGEGASVDITPPAHPSGTWMFKYKSGANELVIYARTARTFCGKLAPTLGDWEFRKHCPMHGGLNDQSEEALDRFYATAIKALHVMSRLRDQAEAYFREKENKGTLTTAGRNRAYSYCAKVGLGMACARASIARKVLIGLGFALWYDKGRIYADGTCKIRVFAIRLTFRHVDMLSDPATINPALVTARQLLEAYPSLRQDIHAEYAAETAAYLLRQNAASILANLKRQAS